MFFDIETLSPLYEDIQLSGIFPDSKFFVDCTPKYTADHILKEYEEQKNNTGFQLKEFVQENFILPAEQTSNYQSANKPIDLHLNDLWNELTRKPDQQSGTLIPLPYPYIVPGGRFREIYYWDSYFTLLGLQVCGRVDLIENMISNFAYLIDTVGFIPNGNRTYYLSRSQPPFFAMMLTVLMEVKGAELLQEFLPQLEKEYAFWMDGAETLQPENREYRRVVRLKNGSVLNRYWDDKDTPRPEAFTEDKHIAMASKKPEAAVYRNIRAAAESGWDFSSRWFADGINLHSIETTEIIPVDLNCLLSFTETMISMAYFNRNDQAKGKAYQLKAEKRKEAIRHFCWNEEEQFYFDYQFKKGNNTPHFTLAAVFPLFFHIATIEQCEAVEKIIATRFLKAGGVVTTLNTTIQQWDSPNGWAPLQWMAYKGLKAHAPSPAAEIIRTNWMALNEKTYTETGKMMEKYNVADISIIAGGGEYPNQDGFGWTNGVYLAMKAVTL